MHYKSPHRGAFTLIELLVVIAIIAILAVVVVLVLNPAQLLAQSRDANRVSDMATLNSALNLYSTDQSGASGYTMGSSSVVYASLPDASSTSCTDLGLPAMPTGYAWGCTTPQALRNASSSGWVPVDLKAISSGSPLGSLPIDPVNSSSSRLFYTYTTNGTQYEVTASMESQKYRLGGSGDVIAGDGSSLATVYAKGTNLALEPLDYGDPSLVGYWPLDEGANAVAYDDSGNNATGSWQGTQAGTSGYYSPGLNQAWAGYFNGSNNEVGIGTSSLYGFTGPMTVAAWAYVTTSTESLTVIDKSVGGVSGYHFADYYGTARFCINTPTEYCSGNANTFPTNAWAYVVGVYDGSSLRSYVDGTLTGLQYVNVPLPGATNPLLIGYGQQGGWNPFYGDISGVRVYGRALSSGEVAALFSGNK